MNDREERYKAALEAAKKAGNPYMVASIEAAMRGESFDPFVGLPSPPVSAED